MGNRARFDPARCGHVGSCDRIENRGGGNTHKAGVVAPEAVHDYVVRCVCERGRAGNRAIQKKGDYILTFMKQ